VPITSTFFTTGNNLVIGNDLTRRALLCQLDAGVERPELRSFKSNVLEVIRVDRGKLVCAALTILRAWHLARTAIGVDPLGSFEDWSYRIRLPLLWLDQADPCDSLKVVRENDPSRSELNTVLMQWKEKLGLDKQHTVQQIIARAVVDPDFYGALMAVAAPRQGTGISNDRLGRYLARNNGKIVGRLKLAKVGNVHGYLLWSVIEI
jgi:putative DNA primase/helicase